VSETALQSIHKAEAGPKVREPRPGRVRVAPGPGAIERAGRRADELVELLAAAGYEVRVKKLVPEGPEAKLTLEVTFAPEKSLFAGSRR